MTSTIPIKLSSCLLKTVSKQSVLFEAIFSYSKKHESVFANLPGEVFELINSLHLPKKKLTDMKLIGILVALCMKTVCVENLMIPSIYQPEMVNIQESVTQKEDYDEENQYDNIENPFAVIGLNDEREANIGYDRRGGTKEIGTFGFNKRIDINQNIKKPCLVVLVSNSQSNPSVQSLLRKYRYDANGILIPSSVKYYIKMHQEYGSAPILVPLTGKAFSPLGGFVRYYKEVPPIPPSM